MKGFRTFLLRGNVIDLAVAVVMGVAFNNIVQALVKDVITPLISAAGVIAAVVYFLLVAPMSKVLAFSQRNKEAAERQCPECLSLIPYKASRCMYCTAALPPATASAAVTQRSSVRGNGA